MSDMSDAKKITVQIKTVYGIKKIYPMDDDGKLFARLARTTTLTPEAVELIKGLGYTIEVKSDSPGTL